MSDGYYTPRSTNIVPPSPPYTRNVHTALYPQEVTGKQLISQSQHSIVILSELSLELPYLESRDVAIQLPESRLNYT